MTVRFRPLMALVAALTLATAGCSAAHGSSAASTKASRTTPVPSATAATPRPQDVALIIAMYENINRAFKVNPNAGVRALIATQYPGDRADVDFARCVNA